MREYRNSSVQTTWTILYDCIRQSDPAAAKLLQLQVYLDHQDLWYRLLARGSQGAGDPDWFEDIVGQELRFKKVIKKLLAYLLAESHRDRERYQVYPVIYNWCLKSIRRGRLNLIILVLKIVGFATPTQSELVYRATQQRLLPYTNRYI